MLHTEAMHLLYEFRHSKIMLFMH